tara:strand:+ start:1383 stop:3317 length:1935 start_codon:yes stop_codon:yes gene_type:complete
MPRVATTINISNPKRYGYDIKLDDMLLRAAVGPGRDMTIQSSDVEGGQVNVRQNAEDFTSNLGRVFSRNDFSGGSNLDSAHRRDGTEKDTIRFWDSSGVDVFGKDLGNSYNISLLNTTTNLRSLSSSDADNYLAQVGTTIYVSDDATLYKSDDGGETYSAQSHGITGGQQIKGMAAHGDLLYMVANNGSSAGEIETLNSSGTSTQKSTAHQFDGIWSVKGKFLVSAGTGIYEYDGATTVSSVLVTLASGETWTDVVDAGAVVLATATDGRIYSFKDVSGSFTLKGQTEITNEIPTCIAESNGIVFYGTREDQTTAKKIGRLYRANLQTADDLYVLGENQLIKEWDIDNIDASPKKIYATRDSVYTGIKESASTSFLWRYYLPSAGIARYYKAAAGGLVTGICKLNEKFSFVVSGSGLFAQTSVFESEGFLLLPAVDFFTAENKQFVGAEVSTELLTAGTSVEIDVSTKFESLNNSGDSSFDNVITQTTGTGDNEVQIEKVSRYLVGKITLKTSNTANTPKVKSIQFRALARPELVVARIPINISDRVNRPNRKPVKVKGLGDALYNALRDKEGDAVTLEIFDPNEIIRGVVESISYPVQSNTEVGSVVQYAILTVRGTRQNVVTDVTSAEVFGINALGFMKFGA